MPSQPPPPPPRAPHERRVQRVLAVLRHFELRLGAHVPALSRVGVSTRPALDGYSRGRNACSMGTQCVLWSTLAYTGVLCSEGTHAHSHARTHPHGHMHTHTDTNTHAHTHAHTLARTHTHTLTLPHPQTHILTGNGPALGQEVQLRRGVGLHIPSTQTNNTVNTIGRSVSVASAFFFM
jgi:hypothetical protein